jgi:hypothetical protein
MRVHWRRKFFIRWMPWLLILLLLVYFQADLLSRSKDYSLESVTHLSRALDVFGGNWEKQNSGQGIGIKEEEDHAGSSDCEAWLEQKDKVQYSRNFMTHPIIVGYGEIGVSSLSRSHNFLYFVDRLCTADPFS